MVPLSWICPICKVKVATPFCGRCGEEPVRPRDLSLRGLAEKIFMQPPASMRAPRNRRGRYRRLLAAAVVIGYRFVLFFITLHGT